MNLSLRNRYRDWRLRQTCQQKVKNRPDFSGFHNFTVSRGSIFPIAFVGQPEYFRQNYFDAVAGGKGVAFDIKSGDLSALEKLPDFIRKNQCKSVLFFRPEWLSRYPHVWKALQQDGIYLIGYSTEPVPTSWSLSSHADQWIRLSAVLDALKVPFDVMIHFDRESKKLFDSLGFKKVLYWPLPVSRGLFFKKDAAKKYDVCFIGRSTDYRERFLGPLKSTFNIIHVSHGIFDEGANDLMNESKILLNIHNHDYRNFETRVIQAIRAGVYLLSEPLSGGWLIEGQNFGTFRESHELYSTVHRLLETGEWRRPMPMDPVVLKNFDIESVMTDLEKAAANV